MSRRRTLQAATPSTRGDLSDPPGIIGSMLTVKETMTLDLERTWWRHPAVKDTKLRELFGETPTRYYQRLNALLDDGDALAYDPQTVNRLRRLRRQRAAQRTAGR